MRQLSRYLLFAMSLAVACRSVPAGPPPPDAESIVRGTAGPGVHTDTIDDAFTVSVNRAYWRARESSKHGQDFWTDVAALDVTGAERSAQSLDERTFALALRTLMLGDPDAAAVAFGVLHRNATDPVLRARARV